MKTAYNFKVIILILSSLALSACGGSGGGSSDEKATNPSTPAITQPGGTSPVVTTPSTFTATYFTLVKNANVTQGGHTYPITMTGHCVVYQSNDYCWDDGFQSIPAINYKTSFWQLCYVGGTFGQCNGGVDPVTTPHLWSAMAMDLVTPPFQPSDVYTQGIGTSVTCTTTGTTIDCVDFAIDTTSVNL